MLVGLQHSRAQRYTSAALAVLVETTAGSMSEAVAGDTEATQAAATDMEETAAAAVAVAVAAEDPSKPLLGLVDLVFTWVDGDDPAHASKMQELLDVMGPNDGDCPGLSQSMRSHKMRMARQGRQRFSNHDELLFALRSVEMFLPSLARKVHIVMDDQVPRWLNMAHPQINLVSHASLWSKKELLPVFNSYAIETQLINIADLSDYFFFMNDDMLFGRPIRFTEAWLSTEFGPALLLEPHLQVSAKRYADRADIKPLTSGLTEWDALDYRSALLDGRFGRRDRAYVSHMPNLVDKRIWTEVTADFGRELTASSGNKFRGCKDIHMKFLLAHYRIERFWEELLYDALRSFVDTDRDAVVSLVELRVFLSRYADDRKYLFRLDERCLDGLANPLMQPGLGYRDFLLYCSELSRNISQTTLDARGIAPGDPWYPYRYQTGPRLLNLFITVKEFDHGWRMQLQELFDPNRPMDAICINDDTVGSLGSQMIDASYRELRQKLETVLWKKSSFRALSKQKKKKKKKMIKGRMDCGRRTHKELQ